MSFIIAGVLPEIRTRSDDCKTNDSYITSQTKIKGDFYGASSSKTACEVLAVYNALVYLEKGYQYDDVKAMFQRCGAVSLGGGWAGSNPFSINKVLIDYGIAFENATYRTMNRKGGYILSYWDEGLWLHTIFIDYNGDKYTAYNSLLYRRGVKPSNNGIQEIDLDFMDENYEFVVCYYVGSPEDRVDTYPTDYILRGIHHSIFG